MKHLFFALACVILLLSCSSKIIKSSSESQVLYVSYEKFLSEKDTVNAEKLRNEIISRFPRSKETFDFASAEFYERLYPVWTNDTIKVSIIKELLIKYPETNWRRTMYQYLLVSLSNLKNIDLLDKYLDEFCLAFSEDYIPFTTSARYHYIDCKDTVKALNCALQGLENSRNYPKLDYFSPMEWDLEKRSSKISAGSYVAEILIDKREYKKALDLLYDIIDNNSLGIDDETTLCKPYYLLGKAYEKIGDKEKALTYLSKGMIAGDSRNVWTLCDSLYLKASGLKGKSDILDHVRKTSGFDEVIYNDLTDKYGLKDVSAGRIAWGDYDNDGYQDMLLDGRRLFKNAGGKSFIEITSLAFPDTNAAGGGLWGDFDNDGDLDMITKDPETVRLNDGGVFKKVSGEFSLSDNKVSTEGVGIADLNKDGYIDIYFANYENNFVYEKDQLLLGKGNGKFSDVSETSGILPADGKNRAGRGVNTGDFDNDGDQDIYVSNYRLTENFLFRNEGAGFFINIAKEKGVAGEETAGWWGHTIGSEWGDIDNDGDLDLITANLAHPRYIDFSNMTMLYENSGAPDFKFTDIRRSTGIKYEETHSEPAFGDLDNDGYLDIYINDVYEGRRSFLYMNNGNKTFRDVTYLSGTRHFNGWGVAYADIDNDGDLDILSAGGKVQLFLNVTKKIGNWLEIKVTGKDHFDAIGTRLKLFNNNISLIREIQGGKGTTNQHSLVQHFGIGKEFNNFTLEITFPSGEKRTIKVPEINRLITVKE
jgi:tetratricopeptide (TPR) repeat protein